MTRHDVKQKARDARGCARSTSASAIVLAALAAPPAAIAAETASGEESDIFTVLDVSVDATAENAAAARVLARAQGHVTAYQRLINRLVPRPSDTSEAAPTK